MSKSQKPAPAPKLKKGGGSFVWKITLRQTVRSLFTFLWINLLLCIIFWTGLLYAVEQTAATLPLDSVSGTANSGGRSSHGLLDSQFTVLYDREAGPQGVSLHPRLIRRFNLLEGKRRWLPAPGSNSLYNAADSQYQIQVPGPGDTGSYIIAFRLGQTWVWFRNGFTVLLVFEGLSLLGGVFKVQRSVRRTLRPIYDLTHLAQQSVWAQPQQAEDLHLDGAIDTLNAITESHLDTRVVIADEREELRGLAEAINSMLDRLDAAYRSQLRFVSDASHELRTPISVIQGYANLLDRWGKEDEQTLDEGIAAIKAEAQSMKELIEQLLFLARSDNQSIRLQREPFDLTAMVQEVAKETEMIDQAHKLRSDVQAGLRYNGDAGLLKQALRILVDNAVKYTPAGERVVIGAKEQDGELRLWVSDHGVGIASSDLPRLFDRFFRADASRTRETGGTGLGLSIAKWIVDSHRGHLQVVSREGLGTRISILLKPNAAPQDIPSPPPDDPRNIPSPPPDDDHPDPAPTATAG